MKKNLLLCFIPVLIIFIASGIPASAQISCPGYSGYHDPEPPTTALNLTATPTILAGGANTVPSEGSCPSDNHFYSINACSTTAPNTGSEYVYTLVFNPAVVYGALIYIVGGYVDNAVFSYSGTTNNFSGTISYPFQGLSSGSPVGGTVSYFSQVKITVSWTNVSATNSLQFFGYNNSYQLSAFSAITANTSTLLAEPPVPSAIFLGSPVCSVPGWSLDPGSNANLFTWGYNGGPNQGGQMGVYPNANYPYSDGPVIPNNSIYPVTVDLCVSAQNTNSCSTTAASRLCTSISIPGTNTGCSGGGHGYGVVKPDVAAEKENATDAGPALAANSVFPNPATSSVNIAFGGSANHTVELLSAQGQVCKKIEDNTADKILVDVSTLARGVYFIVIYENKIITARKKIVLQ